MDERKPKFGEFVRERRKAIGVSLREFCRRNGFDPANISRIERGISSPPKSQEIINSIAKALELTDDSSEWRHLHQLAAAETGQLPDQFAQDPAKLKRVFGSFDKSGYQWTRAIHLESGADLKLFEARLPELVRKLIHFTTQKLARISCPAGEGIQRPGFDLDVESESKTPFVPEGRSVWELGTNKDVKKKANQDFEKRTGDNTLTANERRNITYVQVSPRKFVGKENWRKEKLALKKWKDVRFYDSADLEEWLELAPAVDSWIAGVFGIRPNDVTSLVNYWENLTRISDPPLQAAVFLASRSKEQEAVNQWLSGPASVLDFEHSSPDDPIDFFAACVDSLDEPLKSVVLSKAIIVESIRAWNEMVFSPYPMLLIPHPAVSLKSKNVRNAQENGHHVFLSATRVVSSTSPIKLSRPLNHELENALQNCGFSNDRARKLTQASGGSLTVLKRRAAVSPSNQVPAWSEPDNGQQLVPFVLAGSWHAKNEFDLQMIEELTGQPHAEAMQVAARFAEMSEPPLLNVGNVWSVVSREDSWDLLARFVTPDMLSRFENVALQVLQEELPKFELDSNDRWMAGVKGKRAKFSGVLRKGIVESLALLASCNEKLPTTIGIEAKSMVDRLVRKILPAKGSWKRWASLSRHLPDLAEAAPDTYLSILKISTEQDDSPVLKLFEETGDAPMSGCLFAGLLWSLETLAWTPQYLTKACLVLAELDKSDNSTRWCNSPISSLQTIFLPWLPYTTATVEQRIRAIKKILESYPEVGWKLLIGLMPRFQDTASPTHFPSWRDWSSTWTREFSQNDFSEFTSACANLVVENALNLGDRWEQVFENITRIPDEWRIKLITGFIESDVERFDVELRKRLTDVLRKTIRKNRDHSDAQWALPGGVIEQLEKALTHIEPDDILQKHLWLFAEWIHKMGVEEHDAKLDALRTNAIREIEAVDGWEGVLALASNAEGPFQVGRMLSLLPNVNFDEQVLPEYLSFDNEQLLSFAIGLAQGRFNKSGWTWLDELNLSQWNSQQVAELLARIGGLSQEAWERATNLGSDIEERYWQRVRAWKRDYKPDEVDFIANKFLSVARPIFAIDFLESCVRSDHKPECELVATALEHAVGIGANEKSTETVNDHAVYPIQQLIGYLQEHIASTEIPTQRLATIEWQYLGLLRYSEVMSKTLFSVLADEPKFFVELIQLMFRSEHDEGQQTEKVLTEEQIKNEKAKMENAYHLLHDWNRIPGTRIDGTVEFENLMDWVKAVRDACRESGHLYVCESQIGQKLAYAPAETEDSSDDAWPCIAVRDVLEEVDSEAMFNGFQIGIFNKRGVVTRSPYAGGGSERKLQEKYESYAKKLAIDWPSTATCLQRLADDYGARAKQEDAGAELRKRM